MPRPVSLLPALSAAVLAVLTGLLLAGLLLAGLLVPVPPAAAAPEADAPIEPLQVTIDDLTPATLPRRGPIRVSGTVTNVDVEVWRAVNLYSFVSDAPMTTAAELVEAAASDPLLPVGERIIDPGPYFTIAELAPGESATYSFEVPRKRIAAAATGVATGAAGVYWFGVHALGEGPEGRVEGADGRARTFLPLVPPQVRGRVDTALVIPIRHPVRNRPNGRIAGLTRWTQSLSEAGQLRRLVEFGAAAGGRPVSWLVDPAVIDAAVRIGAGDPSRSLGPTIEGANPDRSGSPAPATESGGPAGDADEADPTPSGPHAAALAAATTAATGWLDRARVALEGNEILSLPYGDLDVDAAAAHDPAAYHAARKRSGDELAPWGLSATPAVATPAGYLSPAGLGLTDPETTVLVSDRVFGRRAPAAPTVARTDDQKLVVASSATAAGGPGPNDPLSPVSVRQRILSEAALRLLTREPDPLVTVLPADWSPASGVGFFTGLDQDWLHLTTVEAISLEAGRRIDPDRLTYPAAQRDAQLDDLDFAASARLTAAGDALQNLLTFNDRVGTEIADEAMAALSYADRRSPQLSRTAVELSRAWVDRRLRAVTVEAPKAVILSSGSGRFSVTLANNLDESVTVHLDAVTDRSLDVSVPEGAIEIGPRSRSTILLNATSRANGVRNATLLLTDSDGTPLGSSDSLPIRSNQVSNVIWLILGTGVALLFATIVVRLVRRIRAVPGS